MAEPVKLELGPQGQKKYELVCDTAAIRRYEQGHSSGIWELCNVLQEGRLPKHMDVVRAFWAMARSHNAKWTLPMAEDLVTPSDYPRVLAAVAKALAAAFVDPDAPPAENGEGGGPIPTGASSTHSA